MPKEPASLPIDYWVEGYLISEIKIGEAVQLNRKVRNGKEVPGYFNSSIVTKIEDGQGQKKLVHTLNSVYVIEPITVTTHDEQKS